MDLLALAFPDVAAAPSGLRRLAFALQRCVRIAGEPPDGPQRHVADDAGNAKLGIVDQAGGELLIAGKVGADEARHIVDGAANLPALDNLLDRDEPLLEI